MKDLSKIPKSEQKNKQELTKELKIQRIENKKLKYQKDRYTNKHLYMKDKIVECDHIQLKKELFAESFEKMIKEMEQQKKLSQDICKLYVELFN